MKAILKHLWLAISLILAASAILLMSDLKQRVSHERENAKSYPSIAVMQIASTTLLETHIAGVVSRLKEGGCVAPDARNIRFYNPQGDYATANAMARDMVHSPYDMIITSSTVALQVVAKANTTTQKTHVFGAVTDPYGAGVGITGPEPHQHPPYMAGVGSFQPVRRTMEIARDMNPGFRRLGVVWNPGEQCSEACLKKAREACGTLGIELVEANAGNTSEVPEALRSVLARNVEAVWIGGDNVAISSIHLIIDLAGEAGIPVFTNDPTDAEEGALFGLGADYYTVGQYTGDIAVAILEGKEPSTFRIENVVPEQLAVNRQVLASLKGTWQITPLVEELLARSREKPAKAPPVPEPGRTYRVGLSYFVPAPIFDIAIDGFKDGLADLGFVEGDNVELIEQHANGDMSFLPQATATLVRQRPDILVALSTPCLNSAIAHSEGIDIAFAIVSAPLEAGAGKSLDHHLPNVTGIVFLLPTREVFEWAKLLFPRAKRIGVLYNPSEANSVQEIELLKSILDQLGLDLVKGTVNNVSEIPENIRGLLAKDVDLFFSMAVNVVANGMPAIIKACQQQRVPVIADDISLMGSGALMSWAPGPYSDGRDLAELTARILVGESPADVPIAPGKEKQLTLDLLAMKRAGITPPVDLLKQADVFFNLRSEGEPPANIALVNLVENVALLDAIKGVETALSDMRLREQTDFIMTKYCAQGDMSQLSQILDRVQTNPPDALVTVSTPVFIAAARRDFDFPVIFTVCSDPEKLGLFKGGRPDNVCGIHDDPPVDQLLEMAREYDPALGAVGIIYDAAQMNSLISVEKLRQAGKEQQVKILEATASTVSDLPMAARSVVERGARALILSADNLAVTGFPAIHKAARSAGIPIYTTDVDLVAQGADGAIGDSYSEWGRASGELVARVLAGVPPARLPVMPTQVRHRVEPRKKTVSQPAEPFRLCIVLYSETEFAEQSRDGLIDGINRAGLEEGQDYELKIYNAQGDMSTLSSIMTPGRRRDQDCLHHRR
jgi:ABC-type uncharacterized transport system substrate-binding protein